MANQPRRHHYVPQFYLLGFTESFQDNGALHVFDQEQRRQWKNSPKGSAYTKDFHAIDVGPDTDCMIVEKMLSEMEGRWAKTLQSVIAEEAVPEGEEYGNLMQFMGFMFARVPGTRNILDNFTSSILGSMNHLMLSTSEGRTWFRKKYDEVAQQPLTDDKYDELIKAVLEGKFEFAFEQTFFVEQMLRMGEDLTSILAMRKWQVWRVEADAPDLICSDCPVALAWVQEPSHPLPPNFSAPGAIASIPLNRRVALVSLFEDDIGSMTLDKDGVAFVNLLTMNNAKQIYSSQKEFVWASPEDGGVKDSGDLVKALKDRETEVG